jgi:hypothetical protein
MLSSVSRTQPRPKEFKNKFYFRAYGAPPPRVVWSSEALSTSLIPTALSLVNQLLCYCQQKQKQEGVASNNKADINSESILKIVVAWVVTSIVLSIYTDISGNPTASKVILNESFIYPNSTKNRDFLFSIASSSDLCQCVGIRCVSFTFV